MQNTSPIKRIVRDTRFYTIAKIVPSFLGFIAIIIYTRILSPEEYGLYILVITVVSMVVATSSEWLNKSILRYFEKLKKTGESSKFISTIFGTLFATITVSLFIWYLGVFLLKDHFNHILLVMLNFGGLMILTHGTYTFILSIKQASQKSHEYTTYSILNALIKLSIAILLISLLHFGPKGILLGMIISSGCLSIYGILTFYTKYKIKLSNFSKKLFKKFISYGFPLIGLSLASYVLSSVDRYMIKYFLDTNEVGIYSANYGLASGMIQPFLVILLLSAYPIIMETFENKGKVETSHLLNKVLSIYFIILIPVIFGMTILSKNISNIFLGQSFQSGYIILPLIALSTTLFGLTQYLYKPFEIMEKTKTLSILVFCAAIINIILNLFFIPKFGILGAAYATLISYGCYLTGTYLMSRKIFPLQLPWKTIIKSIIASVFMCLVLYLVFPTHKTINILALTLKALIGVICYSIIIFLLKEKNALFGLSYTLKRFKKCYHLKNK